MKQDRNIKKKRTKNTTQDIKMKLLKLRNIIHSWWKSKKRPGLILSMY
jgi:hypothetical protein